MEECTSSSACPGILRDPAATLSLLLGNKDAYLADAAPGTVNALLLFETLNCLNLVSEQLRQRLTREILTRHREIEGLLPSILQTCEPGPCSSQLDELAGLRDALCALDQPPEPLPLLNISDETLASPGLASSLAWLLFQDTTSAPSAARAQICNMLLESLSNSQDPQSGLWPGNTPLAQVYASARAVLALETLRRPIRHVRLLIDAALRQQKPSGLFSEPGTDGSQELSLSGLLACLSRQSDYRRDDITSALLRLYTACSTEIDGHSPPPGGTGIPEGGLTRLSNLSLTCLALLRLQLQGLPVGETRRPARLDLRAYFQDEGALSPLERLLISNCLLLEPPAPVREPAASVVVLCYNLGRYLPEALASVCAQSFSSFELLVMDDGSTDQHTLLVMQKLEQSGFRVLRQSNQGQARARNNAIAQTRGAFISCLDADDTYHPEFLQETVRALHADPRAGIATCHYQCFDGYTRLCAPSVCSLETQLVANEIPEAALFRRSTFEKTGGYYEHLHGMEDWDLWLSMLETGASVALIPRVLFNYRIRENSMYTRSRTPENYRRRIALITERHRESFCSHIVSVLSQRAAEFSRLIEVWRSEQVSLSRLIDHSERSAAAYLERIAQLEEAKAWLEGQWHNWEKAAREAQASIAAQHRKK